MRLLVFAHPIRSASLYVEFFPFDLGLCWPSPSPLLSSPCCCTSTGARLYGPIFLAHAFLSLHFLSLSLTLSFSLSSSVCLLFYIQKRIAERWHLWKVMLTCFVENKVGMQFYTSPRVGFGVDKNSPSRCGGQAPYEILSDKPELR